VRDHDVNPEVSVYSRVSTEFNFYPGGHSVIRSDYLAPCTPYEYLGINRVGFYSHPPNPNVYDAVHGPKFRLLINDSEPIFFYCGAPGSCYKEHMIGVINPVSLETTPSAELNPLIWDV